MEQNADCRSLGASGRDELGCKCRLPRLEFGSCPTLWMFQDSKNIQVPLLAMCFALSEGNLVVCLLRPSKISSLGTSLEVQWLRCHAANAGVQV